MNISSWITNWKTTILGVAAIATSIGGLLSALASGDMNTTWHDLGIVLAGLMGVVAKDA